MSELLKRTALEIRRGRREGRVPTAPMVRVQQKARGRTTGTGGSSGLPCAMVLTVSFVLFPVTIAWLPPSPVRRESVFTTLAPALERQNHTTSPSAQTPFVRAIIALGDVRPSHPIPNVRDDREPPLYGERDKRKEATDLGVRSIARGRDTMARRANYADEACTFAYRIESVAEIRSSAQAILRPKPLAKAARQTTIERIRARRSNHDASDTSVRSPQEEHTGTGSRRPIGDEPAAIKIDNSGP